MKQAVADASFCGAWILEDEISDKAEHLLKQIVNGSVELVVPALWHYEMNNLLRSAHRRKRLSEEDAREALETLNQVPLIIEDLPEGPARKRILHLAFQFDLSSYDAAYLELADRHKITLHSADAKLKAAAKQLGLLPK
ncbi:MAG: type II toxin-antitoxin system VapC family toxin [Chthoniobacterales bacterium]